MKESREKNPLAAIQEQIVAQQFEPAIAALTHHLSVTQGEIEALYMRAVCYRYTKQFELALSDLETLKALSPGHGRAHQEAGHIYRDRGQPDKALQSYRQACQANPALEASYRNQLEILIQQGREPEARQVKAQLDRLMSLPRPLVAVTDLIGQGKLLRAEEICRQFLTQVPGSVEGMRLLAEIGSKLGVLHDAEFLLESAVLFEPDNIQVKIDYIHVLRKRQKFAQALAESEKLLALAPDNVQFQSIHAIECMQTGNYEKAIGLFDAILERVPNDPNTLTSRGHAQKTLGRFDEAVDSYRTALASYPAHGEAYYSLANLKTYTFSADELVAMHVQEDNTDLTHMDRVHLFFALGKAYEDNEDYDRSFNYYDRGNGLKKAQSRYRAERMTEEMAAQREVCTRELFERKHGMGHDAPDPIFIVGLPRAGSTLLEQILSSHSQVDGTLELPNILSLSQQLRRGERITADSKYPLILPELTAEDLEQFGEQYISDTRIHRKGAPFFIDKMPNNFRHIGLIRLILPNAKIIDARRDPMACCFSGFKQLFAEGQEFSYDLKDLGHYYRDYVELMDHFDAVLPEAVLRVQYEDVVDDLESQVRRMLDYLGLPFEESCLTYYETERSIRTPSSEQVRKPVFREGVDQWRAFEAHLAPLKDALGPLAH